jgi:hypothetical protein
MKIKKKTTRHGSQRDPQQAHVRSQAARMHIAEGTHLFRQH